MNDKPGGAIIGAQLVIALLGCSDGLYREPGQSRRTHLGPPLGGPTIGSVGRPCGRIGSGGARTLALAPDDSRLAIGYGDGRIQVQGLRADGPGRVLDAHAAAVTATIFLSDGSLVSAAADGEIEIRDAEGSLVRTLVGAVTPIVTLAASRDAAVIAAYEAGGTLRTWRAADGVSLWARRVVELDPESPARSTVGPVLLAFAADGLWAVDGQRQVVVHRREDGAIERTFALPFAPIWNGDRPPFALSRDGTRAAGIVAGTMGERGPTYDVVAVELPGSRQLWSRPSTSPFSNVRMEYSADGAVLAISDGSKLTLVDAETGAERAGRAYASATHLAPTKARDGLVHGRLGGPRLQTDGDVHLLGVDGDVRQVARLAPGHSAPIEQATLSPDGALVATVGSDGARLWRLRDGALVAELLDAFAVTFAQDGAHLAVVSRPERNANEPRASLSLVRVEAAGVLESIPLGECHLAAFTADRGSLWAACAGRRLRRLAVRDGSVEKELRTGDRIAVSLALSPDDRLLAIRHGAESGPVVVVWDTIEERRLWEAERNQRDSPTGLFTTALAFSPDGRHLAVGSYTVKRTEPVPRGLRLYEAATGRLHGYLDQGGGGAVAFSRDGGLIATAIAGPPRRTGLDRLISVVRAWRTSDWAAYDPFDATSTADGVGAISFSPTADELVFGAADQTLHRYCEVAAR